MVRKNGPEMNGCYHGFLFIILDSKTSFFNQIYKINPHRRQTVSYYHEYSVFCSEVKILFFKSRAKLEKKIIKQ